MRRFGLIVFVLSVLFALAGLRQEAAEPVAGVQGKGAGIETASAGTGSKEPAKEAAAIGARQAELGPDAAQADAVTASAAAPDQIRTAAILRPAEAPSDSRPGGAEANELDPAIAALSGRELVRTTQRELKRLGCYKAKVDGKWGRMSRTAVESFAERAGDDWAEEPEPEPELVAALKGFPDGFCSAECTERGADGACVVASQAASEPLAKIAELPAPAVDDDNSYLPPWMRGNDASAAEEPPVEAAPAEQAAPVTTAPRRRAQPQRTAPRAAERYERRRPSSRDWTPQGWPGTAN